MIVQKSVHPYSRADIPRYTPEGTVPVSGGEPDWSAEWAQAKTATADALKNPTAPGAAGPTARHGAATAADPRFHRRQGGYALPELLRDLSWAGGGR